MWHSSWAAHPCRPTLKEPNHQREPARTHHQHLIAASGIMSAMKTKWAEVKYQSPRFKVKTRYHWIFPTRVSNTLRSPYENTRNSVRTFTLKSKRASYSTATITAK